MQPPRKRAIVAALSVVVGLVASALLRPAGPQAAENSAAPPTMDHAAHMAAAGMMPTLPGQDAFGAMQEIVRILEADPHTDWAKVDFAALRAHLVDMNEVTLKATVVEKPIDGGIQAAVTGSGRTLAAIQRMLPAHAQELSQLNGWTARTEPLADGLLFTVTTKDAADVQHLRGLGFFGLLVSGNHHQPHHLAMARGGFSHAHQ